MLKVGLQVVLIAIAAVAFVTGAMGVYSGVDDSFWSISATHASGTVVLDSNVRFFSGMWLGVGLLLLWIAAQVERRGELLGLLAIPIFLGGLGRVAGMVRFDMPMPLFAAFTVLELIFPALYLWQRAVVHSLRPLPTA